MPVITLEAGKLNREQKSQLAKEFTSIASVNATASIICDEKIRPFNMNGLR